MNLSKFFQFDSRNKYLEYFVLIIVFLAFWHKGVQFLDPDFGWHFRLGQIVSDLGIPKTEPFSFAMPSYPFVDYEWVTNLIYFKLYKTVGFVGLSFIHSLLVVSIPFIIIPRKLRRYRLLIAISVWSVLLLRFGVRPQVISWFFLAVTIGFINPRKNWEKYKWYFPILMFIWTNLHGSYLLGLMVVVLWLVSELVRSKTVKFQDVLIILLAFLATFVNPYGISSLEEIMKQMGQSAFFRQTVMEWYPFYVVFEIGFLFIFIFSAYFLWKYRGKYHLWEYVLFIGFLLLGSYSVRHTALFVVVASPMLAKGFDYLSGDVRKIVEGAKRMDIFYNILLLFLTFVFIITYSLSLISAKYLSESNFYPIGAVEYLKERGGGDRVFSKYGWGGYLDWKMPERKYYIDGRMAGFRWNAPQRESNHVFRDYMAVLCGYTPLQYELDKYDVGIVLWPRYKYGRNENNKQREEDSLISKFFPLYCNIDKPFLAKLEELEGWKKEYEDTTSVIYTRI